VNALFGGLKPAVIAIVLLALLKIGKKSLSSALHWTFAALAFISIFFLNIPFPAIVLTALLAGLMLSFGLDSKKVSDSSSAASRSDQKFHFSGNALAVIRNSVTGCILWLLPFALYSFFAFYAGFWKDLILFFTKAALVTFGGAYAVLPYVAQVSVEQYGWLTELQMIDGLALGETTPGPLIMVLAFVGFMAGFNHFGGSVTAGTLGLVTTVYYTFLPCFLFIFIGAPLIEHTSGNESLKKTLGYVTAAVVGVILNLSLFLGKAVLFPGNMWPEAFDWVSLAWVIVSVLAMYRFGVGMILWIGLSAVFGVVRYFLGN
jgi:chromate transporter